MSTLASILGTLLEHADLITLIVQAIEGGVTKASLVKAIEAEMVNASDAAMKAELGG